jgi:hypothetical protein
MRIQEHWDKAMRLEATREKKLVSKADYELLIWACIHGGAHLANVALHGMGVTEESFDLIHSNIPKHDLKGPAPMAELLATLKTIEDLGPRYVRGIEPIDAAAVKACLAAYQKVREHAAAVRARAGGAR